MINNDNSVLTTLAVKFWSGYKYDKSASLKTIEDNHMEQGSGNFNKKLLPKFALKDIKDVITQFKYYFTENTLPYNALLGTRILPTSGFMEFQRSIIVSQNMLKKAVREFEDEYAESKIIARQMLGDLYNDVDYPDVDQVAKRFAIIVNFFPVPEANRFNKSITNTQVKRLNDQMESMSLEAKFDLVNRTEKIARALMHTLMNDGKRIYNSTVINNVNKLSEQLRTLNYDNDSLLIEVKEMVDNNILNIRIDYLKESPAYRTKVILKTQNVIDLVDEINESISDTI